jgi:hypothetical protein
MFFFLTDHQLFLPRNPSPSSAIQLPSSDWSQKLQALSLLCNPTSKLGSITNHNPSSPSKQWGKLGFHNWVEIQLPCSGIFFFLLLLLLFICWSVLPGLGQSSRGRRVAKRVSGGHSLWVFMEFLKIILWDLFKPFVCMYVCMYVCIYMYVPLFFNKLIFKLPFYFKMQDINYYIIYLKGFLPPPPPPLFWRGSSFFWYFFTLEFSWLFPLFFLIFVQNLGNSYLLIN